MPDSLAQPKICETAELGLAILDPPPQDSPGPHSNSPGSISTSGDRINKRDNSNADVEQHTRLFREIMSLLEACTECDAFKDVLKDVLKDAFKDAFIHAAIEPPHTRDSMKELNIESIVNNPKLRRDINFEPRLAFRPTEDNGRQSQQKARNQRYAEGLAAELVLFGLLSQLKCQQLTSWKRSEADRLLEKLCNGRLKRLLIAMREILETMITQADQADLKDHFDIELRLQEIAHGTCDFVKLIQWLGRLLKTHCAPVRDQHIDNVVSEIAGGNIQSISTGLVNLLEVLEQMKLDIANHQVRHLKSYFMNWTFPFELKYHGNRIAKGRIEPGPIRNWFSKQMSKPLLQAESPNTASRLIPHRIELKAFIQALVQSVLPKGEKLPESFDMDSGRIKSIRSDLEEILQISICFSVFMSTWEAEFVDVKHPTRIPLSVEVQIFGHMRVIASHGGGVDASIPNIAAGIVKWISELMGRSDHKMSQDKVAKVENELTIQLEKKMPKATKDLLKPLVQQVFDVATENMDKEYFEIFKRLVPQPPVSKTSHTSIVAAKALATKKVRSAQFPDHLSSVFAGQLCEIVNRVAHIAILHWRVWSELIYLHDDFGEESTSGTQRHHSKTKTSHK